MTTVDWTARGAAATAREIAQQPRLWREVAQDAERDRARTDAFLQPLLAQPDLRIVLTGAGTSAFAGGLIAPALARTLRRRVEAVPTTDVVSNPAEVFAEDVPTLLVSFARSGDSPESVAATALAEQCLSSVHHLVVTCNPEGRLAKEMAGAERSLVLQMPEAAHDEGFAMTSSFTCMVLATWLRLAGGDPGVGSAAAAAERLLAEHEDDLAALAARGYTRVVYLGSGPLTALAQESALKMLELTAGSVVAWFDSALGFRHGPKSVLDDETLTVVLVSTDAYTRQYDEDIAAELLRALDPKDVLVISAGSPSRLQAPQTWELPELAGASDVVAGLAYVVVAQLLALHTSLALGLTPDNPFPSGEVNRVVQGVTVHPLGGAGA
ncbi:galactosamine 6-phosphate isomerase AgaS [Motilibacter rhizosphaerae]|uniref:Galactosamine 6-phosphate isomerase AgaS n=1 Tax=Motilibacter rhizosphaerae TaxID=598652 RepID=A0A4Q7NVJ7_9ACTN|nr:SIS domain-containing protein [Motilibacter rhizosphaerae]RZS90898.1 galactosamine 6-phosphate isomerase AgaS [Motilibacter rhizosphaerae]